MAEFRFRHHHPVCIPVAVSQPDKSGFWDIVLSPHLFELERPKDAEVAEECASLAEEQRSACLGENELPEHMSITQQGRL